MKSTFDHGLQQELEAPNCFLLAAKKRHSGNQMSSSKLGACPGAFVSVRHSYFLQLGQPMHTIRPMALSDYDGVIDLMKQTPGVSFRDADSLEATARYLERNPNLSFVAHNGKMLIGCVMSGHDGRRGYLQHLVVHPEHRRNGVASALVEKCLSGLEQLGILKTHIDVLKTNSSGQAYWERQGWQLRTDINCYSFIRSDSQNA